MIIQTTGHTDDLKRYPFCGANPRTEEQVINAWNKREGEE